MDSVKFPRRTTRIVEVEEYLKRLGATASAETAKEVVSGLSSGINEGAVLENNVVDEVYEFESAPKTEDAATRTKWFRNLHKNCLKLTTGQGTLRKQLLMVHGVAWYCMVSHCIDSIAWSCMVLHGIAWHCMVFHGISWYCVVLHVIARYITVLHGIAR